MWVKDRMIQRPVEVTVDTSIEEARELMRREGIQCLPVLDENGQLVGVISDLEIAAAAPSPATALDRFEIHSLLPKIRVRHVVRRDIATVGEDTSLGEAARIMADRRLAGLPVMRDGKLVGMITEASLLRALQDALQPCCCPSKPIGLLESIATA